MSLSLNVILASRLALPIEFVPEGDTVSLDSANIDVEAMIEQYQDSAASGFTYENGTVQLENGVASLTLPAGFKFLNAEQSAYVLVDLWGNEDANGVLGMVFPQNDNPFTPDSYAYVVTYDDTTGYVEDDDAEDIDYDEMLKNMQAGEEEYNKARAEKNIEPMYLIGWASAPYYDKEHKVLHWAKELKFGDSAATNTLNYNVRVLGRKGVLVLNAVADMSELDLVKQHVPEVLSFVQFNDGYKYEQFDSSVDKIAAYGIGGLIAGKVLAKAGIFAVIAKFLGPFLKFIWIGLIAIGGGIWKFITGRRKKDETLPPATTYKP